MAPRKKQLPEVDEFSYASPEDPRFKRLVIQLIERITGQPELKRMYLEHQNNPKPGESFWDAAINKLGLKIDLNEQDLSEIPRTGPVIIVANHPFGVLDGLMVCWLISRVRTDFKVLTNALLNRAEEIKPYLLPIDFEETKAALETNIKTRAESKALLEKGGRPRDFPRWHGINHANPPGPQGKGPGVEDIHGTHDCPGQGPRRAGLLRWPELETVPDRKPHQHDAAPVTPVQGSARQDRRKPDGQDRKANSVRDVEGLQRPQGTDGIPA
jgi:hypothetical protein